jgi:hypothetical protein
MNGTHGDVEVGDITALPAVIAKHEASKKESFGFEMFRHLAMFQSAARRSWFGS